MRKLFVLTVIFYTIQGALAKTPKRIPAVLQTTAIIAGEQLVTLPANMELKKSSKNVVSLFSPCFVNGTIYLLLVFRSASPGVFVALGIAFCVTASGSGSPLS